MNFQQTGSEIFVPDSFKVEPALQRTTHLCIAAHQDDIEIMAAEPILTCFQKSELWFCGVVVTDGRGSPRDGIYKEVSDEDMRLIRNKEQKKAAVIGEYTAQVMLDYPSMIVKDPKYSNVVSDFVSLLEITKPKFVYTHNLTDKHDTHIAVALRVIEALRQIPEEDRPEKVFGCEVWRDLDWLMDVDKIPFDLSVHENLQSALLGVFDSQIAGGKRYDLATMGRRKANATYFESHGVDAVVGQNYGMDLTPLIIDTSLDIGKYVNTFIERFSKDITTRISRFQ